MGPFGTVSLTKRWNMQSRHDVDSQILTRKNFITRGYILNTLKKSEANPGTLLYVIFKAIT